VSARWTSYEATYRVLRNVETFAISEDYRLGPRISVESRFAPGILLTPVSFLELGASASWRWLLGEDLLRVGGSARGRLVPSATGSGVQGQWINKRFALELENASPPFGIGRLVARALFEVRKDDLNNVSFLLGGGNGLRALPPEVAEGDRQLVLNLEYRTRPVEVLTLHLGGVLFYDAGSAFDASPVLYQSVGLGLRALFPQFDRQTLRIDFGWVLSGRSRRPLDRVSASFGQITDYRPTFLDDPL
jgi:hypothetical protein